MDLEKAFPSLDAEAFLADDAAYYPTDSDAVGNIGIIDSTACPPAVDLEHEKLVVEVPQLPSSSLVDVRVYIQKTYMQMVDTWEMQVEKQVSSRIQEKVGQLTNELHATLYRYENRRRDVEDQYRNRLEEIGLRAVLNEKEAFIIEHRIEQLKLSFTSSIDRLELLSREFTVSVTLPTIEQLRRIKKSTQMQSARALFNEKLEAHTKFMKESLSSALSTFQYGCDVLKKSRCEQHIQAWRIINQRHPKTDLIYELEAWVSTHDGRIDRVQKEVEAHAIRMEDEVWSHSEEVRFLEAIDDVLSKTKLRLRAEMAYMGQLDMIIHQKLDLLKFLANKENFNWDSVCQLLCTLNELRILIVNMTRYSNSLTESFDPSRVQVPVTLEKTKWMSSGSEFFLLSHPSVKKIITHDTYVGQALTLTQTILSDSLHEIKPTYQERVQLIWDETSASVELKSQEFYSSLRHTIKRTQEIPPTFPEYKKTLDGRMQGLKDDSESRRLDFSKGLLAIVVQYFDIISHSSEHILSSLYKDASFVCEDTWQQESQSFADAWKSEARRRKALYSSMKPRLGHPNNKSELDVFECSAEKLKKDFEGRIVKVRSSYEAALDKIRVQYLVEMEYLKTSFLALMSASVHSNDLIIPGDPPAVPKQTIRSIINARRAKKSLDELPLRSAAASTAVIASDTTERTKSVVSRFAQVHQDFSNRFSQDIRRRQLHVQSQAEEQKARNDLWFANWRDSILQILQLFDPNKSL
ncbi:uncharacterized protein BJ171DRAFT_537048 [Polychytrium aggregatum]|uniref:uncharacterized protein n=1 Tax=Polychytrium aggregatum TaxID=110093 RepID=UPI0022FEB7DC|nr:uncharacterized protein BJ171DRAFT_537048 [Polychytrium aggregatum]KAI9192961.1 hypothetical protein BJ171DRAFT_537048 [Polychytrium aggregatum]